MGLSEGEVLGKGHWKIVEILGYDWLNTKIGIVLIFSIMLMVSVGCDSKEEKYYYRFEEINGQTEIDSGKLISLDQGYAFDWKDQEILFNNFVDGVFFTQDKVSYIRLSSDKKFAYISSNGTLIRFSKTKPFVRKSKSESKLGELVEAVIPETEIPFSPCDSTFSEKQRKESKRRVGLILSVLKKYDQNRYKDWTAEDLVTYVLSSENGAHAVLLNLIDSDELEKPPANEKGLQQSIKAYPFKCE